jgi:hypothetical protein
MTAHLFNRLSESPLSAKQTGRIIFAMDATASRSHVWDTVSKIQKDMFSAIDRLGELEIKLMYFRGDGECKASPWLKDEGNLLRLLDKVTCMAGPTQILRVLDHASSEHDKSDVHALIFIGDSCEEEFSGIETKAEILGMKKLPLFVFHDQNGADTALYARNSDTHKIFKYMAEASNGAYVGLDSRSSKVLSHLLQAVAIYATGGRKALDDFSKKQGVDGAVLKLTAQLK